MPSLLIAPGAPYYLAALAAAFMALLGARLQPRQPSYAAPSAASRFAGIGRIVAGQVAGAVSAAMLIGLALASGATGNQRLMLFAGALAAYLTFGIVMPRLPQIRREREAAALRRLTPGFVAFVRVALGSFEAPIAILRRYVRRPNPRLEPMQNLVDEALAVGADLRLRPFAALSHVANNRGCRELSDVAATLAQAEAEGARAETVLAAHQETLELILQGEFRRLIRRRTMYLLLMVAISLVIGILINLLFVMTGGGSAFEQLR
ncbi:hypothetical protein [Candidatus Viridilinea mediisalina]|uniref:Type II secretion system protein GspF domain-containing protein n=1 Tax=Candidatus Viridilinea mediisalina TaxID=2024553 RepID=A0A2A6RFA4_9CHLR|nr:hypothetical protein [Candidatus Viridilinea mediisalina]PDW01555.1 hypothetical protein CJ255_18520 [Candidatus Viridilinea mediisalina]